MYIVTGGAGFIGSVVVWELNRNGVEDILIVDHLGESEKWKNLVGLRYTDYQSREEFIAKVRAGSFPKGVEGVVHLGACSATTERNAEFLMENNFHYTRDLCLAALDAGARLVNASSAATYGGGEFGFSDSPETTKKLRPLNMYGYTKQLFDMWAMRKGYMGKLASLKFFNVYGPQEYHKENMRSVVCKAVPQIQQEGFLRLFRSDHPDYADGGQMRDFVYVKDCARLVVDLLVHPEVNGVLNVGTGHARSWNDLAKAVFTAMGLEPRIEYVDMPDQLKGKYQNFTQADMSWRDKVSMRTAFSSLEEGVNDYVQGYLLKENPYL